MNSEITRLARGAKCGPRAALVSAMADDSSKPESPHYTDQMESFGKLELKPMTLDLEEVRKGAVRTYNPK